MVGWHPQCSGRAFCWMSARATELCACRPTLGGVCRLTFFKSFWDFSDTVSRDGRFLVAGIPWKMGAVAVKHFRNCTVRDSVDISEVARARQSRFSHVTSASHLLRRGVPSDRGYRQWFVPNARRADAASTVASPLTTSGRLP